MSARDLLETAVLLGLFVALAGAYGVLYALAQLRRERRLRLASFAGYGLQCVAAAAVVALTPLAIVWKALIVFSTLAYFGIPPVTWRYLESSHIHPEPDHDPQSH